jgi:hypothetical protein
VPTDMNAAMRDKRKALDSYMYEAPMMDNMPMMDEESPAEDRAELSTAELTEALMPEGVSAITVLAPNEPAAEDMYTYERMDNGAWMTYPPGVPCEAGTSRIQLDHPATEAEYADMNAAMDAAGAEGEESAVEAKSGSAKPEDY